MKNVLRGILMGTSDLIPGVSGGTIAMVLGIYHKLIAAINGILTKNWREHIRFLVPLLLGIGIALLSLSHLIEWLIEHHSKPLFYFFNGLILGIIPFLLRTADYRKTFKVNHYVVLAVAAILVALTSLVREDNMQAVWTNLTLGNYLVLFLSGWLASSAMILPGISGSLVLLLLGVYPTVINAISSINIPVIIVVGIGVGMGILLTSKLIQFLFREFSILTYAVLIGLVVGSLVVTFPGLPTTFLYGLLCAVMFIIGIMVAVLLSRFEQGNA